MAGLGSENDFCTKDAQIGHRMIGKCTKHWNFASEKALKRFSVTLRLIGERYRQK